MDFLNKTVLITDFSSDIAKDLVMKFIKEGANVVVNTNYKDEKIEAIKLFENKNVLVTCLEDFEQSNIFSSGTINMLKDFIVNKFLSVDVVVFTNDVITVQSIEHCDNEQFDYSLNHNVKLAFLYTQAFGDLMRKNKCGRLVYLNSIHSEKPTGSAFLYSIAKSSVKMLALEAALDFGIYNVTSNVIEIGGFKSDEQQFFSTNSSIYDNLINRIPNKSFVNPSEISDLVLFLASNKSGALNGSVIKADKGFNLSYISRYSYEEFERNENKYI